jgi:DNA mismatch endonuclease (patch repair protein)
MQSNRGRDTGPELALRSAVHRLGLRFFVDRRPIKGVRRSADLVFPRQKVAVLLDGCFWHGCPLHYTAPVANSAFWAEKVAANRRRDEETNRLLREAGWTVLRFWEHDDPRECAAEIRSVVEAARSGRLRD